MKKCLPFLKNSTILLVFLLTASMVNAQKTAVSSTAWSLPTTWSPVGMPGASDAVIIPSGITVTMDAASGECASLTINANAVAAGNGLTISGTNTLTVGGNVTLNQPTLSVSTLAVGTGTLTATGTISIPGSATAGRFATLSVSTGTINCDAVTFSGTAAQARLIFTGAGTLKVGNGTTGTLGTGGTLTMSALNTINYDGIAQTVRPATYNNLILSGSGVKTTTGVTVNDKLSLQGSATAGNTIAYSSAILEYKGSAPQTTSVNEFPAVMATDFIIENPSGVTLDAAKTLSGDLTLTSGTLIAGTNLTISAAGTPLITRSGGDMTGTIQGTFDYDVTYTGNSKTTGAELSGSGFADINVNLTAGQTLTLDQNRVPDDNVTISTGIFDLGGFTLNNSGSNALTVSNGAGLIIGGTNGLPTGYSYSFAATSTVEYAGANQAVGSTMYGHLIASGSGTKTLSTTSATDINGNLSIGSGITFTVGGAAITVDGTTTIDGTLTITSTTGAKSFDNMIVNSGGSFNSSVNEDYSMTGDLQVNALGSFTSGTGIYTWTANGAFSGTATITNIVVNGAGTVILTNNGALTTASLTGTGADGLTQGATGVLNYSGATLTVPAFIASAVGNTVNYTAAAQTIRGVAYSNLTLSGSAAKTLGAATTVNGTLSMQGTASLALGAFALTFGATSTLEYAGSTAQTTTNTEFKSPAGPFNLVINNANGVTLHAARAISGALTLSNGIFNTTSTNLLTMNAGATSGGSSDASFVNGPVRKAFNNSESFVFPIGVTGTGDEPLTIAGITAAGYDFTAEYKRISATSLSSSMTPPVVNVSGCDHWTVDKNAGPATGVSVTLSWDANSTCNGANFVTNPSTLTVAYLPGASWQEAGTAGSFSASTVTRTDVTVFNNPFSLANTATGDNPLPVMFADVKAFEKNGGVQIDWSNLTERDLVKYIVERSTNGRDFTAISEQMPRSNQNDKESYSSFDATPISGVNYYRIKVLEISGKIILSKVMRVDIGRSTPGFTLYPNPVKGNQVSVGITTSKGQYTISVLNSAGQQVYSQRITHQGGSLTQTLDLPGSVKAGVYNMLISGDNYRESKMFVIQ